MAGELGFEPRLAESESAVLPLDDSPAEAPIINRHNISEGAGAWKAGILVETASGFKAFRPISHIGWHFTGCSRPVAVLAFPGPFPQAGEADSMTLYVK